MDVAMPGDATGTMPGRFAWALNQREIVRLGKAF